MQSKPLFRTLPVIAVLLSGCSTFGNSGPRMSYRPEPIYLGINDTVTVGRFEDRDRYSCYRGPLICESFGLSFDCRCN